MNPVSVTIAAAPCADDGVSIIDNIDALGSAEAMLGCGNDNPRRDKEETARIAAYPQLAGRFGRMWQVLSSNQRRRSRRFYRSPSSCPSRIPLTSVYVL